MARPLRIEFPGALYVVTARALPRQRLAREPEEFRRFRDSLPTLAEGLGAVVHGFALLPDHYHLLVETPRGNLARVLHRLNAGYTAGVNARRRRAGPLLRSRYRSVLLGEEWLLPLSVYVHLNPVRRKLSPDPWAYPGSSAGAFAREPEPVPGVTTSRVLDLAGGREAYARRLAEAASRPPERPWGEVWKQTVLGGDELRRRVEEAAAGRDVREAPGFSPRPAGPSLEDVLQVVAEATGVSPRDITRGKFQRLLVRKAAMYLARRFTDLTLREIGEPFGVDYTTVHMTSRRVEELRAEDPGVAELLGELEREMEARLARSGLPAPGPARRPRRKKKPPPREDDPQLDLF